MSALTPATDVTSMYRGQFEKGASSSFFEGLDLLRSFAATDSQQAAVRPDRLLFWATYIDVAY
jgi:hypothetical protein